MGKPLDYMTLTVTRRPGEWSDTTGQWVHDTESYTTFEIGASRPQPVGPELMQRIPEAARTIARYVIYADEEPKLYVVEDDSHAADHVAYDGETYLVTSADKWVSMPLGYRAYILLEVGEDE
jgi:hypothetical protein